MKQHYEAFVRLTIIYSILMQYKVDELSKNGQQFKKQVKKAINKLAKILGKTKGMELVKTTDEIWREAFTKFLNRSILASTFITGIYKSELFAEYKINEKYFEKFLLHATEKQTKEQEQVEVETYEIEDYFNKKICEALGLECKKKFILKAKQ